MLKNAIPPYGQADHKKTDFFYDSPNPISERLLQRETTLSVRSESPSTQALGG